MDQPWACGVYFDENIQNGAPDMVSHKNVDKRTNGWTDGRTHGSII